ncbi:ABC transporter substrate-binding protein [Microbacterium pumilum]|uniref:ABC transporter substrate-binding protein n=1 Tax=Microbacterium pumilum TaxID=344165 RepID=A0ABP5EFS0_9MICO
MRNQKAKIGAASIALAALALTGCASGAPSSDDGGTAAPDTLRVGIFHPDVTFAAFYAATGEDGALTKALEDNGVELQIEYIPSGSNLMAALNGGTLDAALVPATALLAVSSQGGDVAPLAGIYTGAGQMIIGASQYEDTRGEDVDAFDGATWAFTRVGSIGHAVARMTAEEAGLDWADQTELPLGSGSEAQAVLETNRADILVTSPVNAARAVESGVGYLVANSEADEDAPLGMALNTVLAVNGGFEKKYPEFSQVLTTGVLDGLVELKDLTDPEEALALMPPEFVEAVSDSWDLQWEYAHAGIQRAGGVFTETEVEQGVESALLSAAVPEDFKLDETFFDNTYARAAFDALGVEIPEGAL